MEELRRRVREERIKTVEEARTCMCRCIAGAMQVGDPALDLSLIHILRDDMAGDREQNQALIGQYEEKNSQFTQEIGEKTARLQEPVSYTHLDVYKRQPWE